MGKSILAGVALAVTALLAGCGHAGSEGGQPPTGPSRTQQLTTTESAGANSLASRVVKTSCGTQVPPAVAAVIPGATAIYVPKYALGSDCQWSSADYSRRVIAYAITSMPYDNWQKMQALTATTTIAGYTSVHGQADGSCVVLVDVQNVAFEVDLRGISDPMCQTTTTLAGHLLTGSS